MSVNIQASKFLKCVVQLGSLTTKPLMVKGIVLVYISFKVYLPLACPSSEQGPLAAVAPHPARPCTSPDQHGRASPVVAGRWSGQDGEAAAGLLE